MDDLKNKRITVAGLGHFGGGIAVTRWLVAQGARVLVTDLATPEKLRDSLPQLAGLDVEMRLGEHRLEDFTGAELVVASPAIPPASKYLAAAKAARVPVTSEIWLFIERCRASRIIGVTGTKGKSTSTAMLGAMCATRHTTHVGGNIGKSLLDDLPRIAPEDVVVLELSSFMLECLEPCRWSPHVALVTMIAPDHLDRHATFERYVEAKRNIVRWQTPEDFAVVNGSCPHGQSFASATRGRVVRFDADAPRFALAIPGEHNQLNAQGAFAAAACVGVTREDAQRALNGFRGLPHRLALVHEANGVAWYNDSIATIPEAAVAANGAFPRERVIQIVGGSDKGIPFDAMARDLAARAKAILCIGQTAEVIASLVRSNPGHCPCHECGDLGSAVAMARRLSEPGDTVLLSPGCASYGQFGNFEERGERFAELAREGGVG